MRFQRSVCARLVLVVTGAVLAAVATRARGAASFHGVGGLPGAETVSGLWGVSADGRVAVGEALDADGHGRAVYWTDRDGLVVIGGEGGHSVATDASADGSVIVGTDRDRVFRWTGTGGRIDLLPPPWVGQAWGVSGDGSVVTGFYNGAFRWSVASGLQGLGDSAVAFDVSLDGSTVVGALGESLRTRAVRWTERGMERLGDLQGGADYTIAWAVSADGSVVVGTSVIPGVSSSAFIWREGVGISELPGVPDGVPFKPNAISANGSVVVGGSGSLAAVWDEAHGLRLLQDVLTRDYGLDLTGWTLQNALGVSADGSTIVGGGLSPAGRGEGFVAILPEPAAGAAETVLFSMIALRRCRRA